MTRLCTATLVLVATAWLTGCPYPHPPYPETGRGAQSAEARAVPPPTSGDETDGPLQPRTSAQRPIGTEAPSEPADEGEEVLP